MSSSWWQLPGLQCDCCMSPCNHCRCLSTTVTRICDKRRKSKYHKWRVIVKALTWFSWVYQSLLTVTVLCAWNGANVLTYRYSGCANPFWLSQSSVLGMRQMFLLTGILGVPTPSDCHSHLCLEWGKCSYLQVFWMYQSLLTVTVICAWNGANVLTYRYSGCTNPFWLSQSSVLGMRQMFLLTGILGVPTPSDCHSHLCLEWGKCSYLQVFWMYQSLLTVTVICAWNGANVLTYRYSGCTNPFWLSQSSVLGMGPMFLLTGILGVPIPSDCHSHLCLECQGQCSYLQVFWMYQSLLTVTVICAWNGANVLTYRYSGCTNPFWLSQSSVLGMGPMFLLTGILGVPIPSDCHSHLCLEWGKCSYLQVFWVCQSLLTVTVICAWNGANVLTYRYSGCTNPFWLSQSSVLGMGPMFLLTGILGVPIPSDCHSHLCLECQGQCSYLQVFWVYQSLLTVTVICAWNEANVLTYRYSGCTNPFWLSQSSVLGMRQMFLLTGILGVPIPSDCHSHLCLEWGQCSYLQVFWVYQSLLTVTVICAWNGGNVLTYRYLGSERGTGRRRRKFKGRREGGRKREGRTGRGSRYVCLWCIWLVCGGWGGWVSVCVCDIFAMNVNGHIQSTCTTWHSCVPNILYDLPLQVTWTQFTNKVKLNKNELGDKFSQWNSS